MTRMLLRFYHILRRIKILYARGGTSKYCFAYEIPPDFAILKNGKLLKRKEGCFVGETGGVEGC